MKNIPQLKLVSLSILLVFVNIYASKATTYTFSTPGNWNIATNWTGGVVPPDPLPVGDAIVIAANCTRSWYTTINGSITVNASVTLTINNGVEDLTFSINGTGNNNGIIDAMGESFVIGSTGVFTNMSGATVQATTTLGGIENNGQFTNQSGANINVWSCGNSGIFNNNGTITLGFIWTNLAGSTLSNNGNFTNSNGSGGFNNVAGATINMGGGIISLSCGITNSGTINVTSGDFRLLRNPVTWLTGLNWSGGTVTIGGSLSIGSGTTITVPSGATLLRINGNAISIDNGGSLQVNGTFTPQTGAFTVQSGGSFGIGSGGATTFSSAILNNSGSVTNAGTMNLNQSSGQFQNLASGTFNNSGIVNISYRLDNSGSFSNSGTININNNGILGLNTNPATLPGGTLNWNNGGYIVIGSSGVLNLSGSLTVPSGRFFHVNGGQFAIQSDGQFINNGTSYFYGTTSNNGILNNTSTIQVNAAGSLNNTGTLSNSGSMEFFNTFSNSGTFNQTNGVFTFNYANAIYPSLNGTFNWTGGVMRLGGGGTMTLSHAVTIPSGLDFKILGGTLNNASTLISNGIFSSTSGGTLNNNSLFINNGTISNIITFSNNGTLKGSGGLNQGAFTNPLGSTFAPGLSPGCYTIQSGFTNNGTLEIEINGTTACSTFDKVTVTGTANKGGILSLNFGFTPTVGQTFQFISAVSYTGSFNTINITPSNIAVTENNGIITVNSVFPIELLSFSALEIASQKVQLNWQTATENGVKNFDIEKSVDGPKFEKIAEVEAHNTPSVYSAFDDYFIESSYYRLKINDLDGKVSYSKTISLEKNATKGLKDYPNPAKHILTVENAKGKTLDVINALGEVVLREINNETTIINIQSLPNGVYFLKAAEKSVRFFKN